MTDIARERLDRQWLTRPSARAPADVVRAMLAVQSQDYLGGKWSVALRTQGSADADLDALLDAGAVLRTHVLRPTWHFVHPADLRWLLKATSARVMAQNATMVRKLGIDARALRGSLDAVARALEGGQWRTREELGLAMERAGFGPARGQRLTYLVMTAELEGLIASGPRAGKRFTYGLLDERAPRPRRRDAATDDAVPRDELLARLAQRYFAGHGPATARDLARWASLTLAEAAAAVEGAARSTPGLRVERVDGESWYASPDATEPPPKRAPRRRAHLLSVFDEYVNGYRDRSMIIAPAHGRVIVGAGNAVLHVYLLDGRVLGTWTRTLTQDAVNVVVTPFDRLDRVARDALARRLEPAAVEYGRFLGRSPSVAVVNRRA